MEILVVKSQGDGMQELSGGDSYGSEFNRQKYNNMDEQQRWLKRQGAAIDDFWRYDEYGRGVSIKEETDRQWGRFFWLIDIEPVFPCKRDMNSKDRDVGYRTLRRCSVSEPSHNV